MTRAEIVSKVDGIIEDHTGAAEGSIERDKPLLGQACIDSLDLVEIGMEVEEEFGIAELGSDDWPWGEWTVDKLADAVTAHLAAKEGVPQT